jgi:putative DNA primase/helicase
MTTATTHVPLEQPARTPFAHEQAEVQRSLEYLLGPSATFEIRILGVGGNPKRTDGGYFNDFSKAATSIHAYQGRAAGVYFTINEVNPDLLARYNNRIHTQSPSLTADHDILRRCIVPIDIDPVRLAGISSSDAEHNAALERAIEIEAYLHTAGSPTVVRADSGNGAHLLLFTDLPNDEESTALITAFLHALDARFSGSGLKVDTSLFNAARILKCYGTLAAKGDGLPDRPHRRARLLTMPEHQITPRAVLEKIAADVPPGAAPQPPSEHAPPREPQLTTRTVGAHTAWDAPRMEYFFAKYNIRIRQPGAESYQGGLRWKLEECPFDPDHVDGDATVYIRDGGRLGFDCQHDHCKSYHWADFRSHYEPDYKDRRPSTTVQQTTNKDQAATQTETKTRPPKDKLLPPLVNAIIDTSYFAKDAGDALYRYSEGAYRPHGDKFIKGQVKQLLARWGKTEEWTSHLAEEVVRYITVDAPLVWERPPLGVVNVLNGLLNIETRTLEEHTPEFLSVVQLPVKYDPLAQCPAWERMIETTWPADTLAVAWELAAWLMTPTAKIQKSVLLVGEGANGKSTYLGGMVRFIGKSNTANVSLQKLETDRFAPVRLIGKLANICADLPSTHLETTSMFKALTGGDAVSVERKGQDSFDITPFARLVFSANNPPHSKDASYAFFRRWVLIPFNKVISESEARSRDELDAELAAPGELSGVLNKALDAWPRVMAHGITETQSMRDAWNDFRETTDPLAVWLDRNTACSPELYVACKTLLFAYNEDNAKHGRPFLTGTSFGMGLSRQRPGLERKQRTVQGEYVWCYVGIDLRRHADTPSTQSTPPFLYSDAEKIHEDTNKDIKIGQNREKAVYSVYPVERPKFASHKTTYCVCTRGWENSTGLIFCEQCYPPGETQTQGGAWHTIRSGCGV